MSEDRSDVRYKLVLFTPFDDGAKMKEDHLNILFKKGYEVKFANTIQGDVPAIVYMLEKKDPPADKYREPFIATSE